MNSEIEICSAALANVGEKPIQSFTEGTRAASLCFAQYGSTRDEVLRGHPWNFAVRRKVLAQVEDAPVFGYAYAYALPSDCLRVLDIGSAKGYAIEGRQILSNATAINLRYVAKVEKVSEFDSLFCIALAHRIASKLALPLTGDKGVAAAQMELYAAVLGQARAVDAQEEPGQEMEESSLITARY